MVGTCASYIIGPIPAAVPGCFKTSIAPAIRPPPPPSAPQRKKPGLVFVRPCFVGISKWLCGCSVRCRWVKYHCKGQKKVLKSYKGKSCQAKWGRGRAVLTASNWVEIFICAFIAIPVASSWRQKYVPAVTAQRSAWIKRFKETKEIASLHGDSSAVRRSSCAASSAVFVGFVSGAVAVVVTILSSGCSGCAAASPCAMLYK